MHKICPFSWGYLSHGFAIEGDYVSSGTLGDWSKLRGVLLYAFTLYLFAVGMSAVFSFEYLKTSILVIIGVMLFMFSDSRIALNAMSGSNSHSSFVIMLTYILANLFLVLGVWCINVPVIS